MTDIEWTDESWNPIVGCSVVSPGCTNCYAMRKGHRLAHISYGESKGAHGLTHYRGLTKVTNGNPVWTGAIRKAHDGLFLKPLKWRKPRMVFVNSMGDLFHEAIPDALIDQVFAVMALCPQHTFQILTKRAQRMRNYMAQADDPEGDYFERLSDAAVAIADSPCAGHVADMDWPPKNIWLGVSAEDQRRADERIPVLLDTPAALRFVSAEPLLGAIDLTSICNGNYFINALDGYKYHDTEDSCANEDCNRLDWVIAGGESGPGARPPHPHWFRYLRNDCVKSGIPFFFKQWGSWAPVDEFDPSGDSIYHLDGPKAGDLRVPSTAVGLDGRCGDVADDLIPPTEVLYRVGKKLAGAKFQGVEHRAFPEITTGAAA